MKTFILLIFIFLVCSTSFVHGQYPRQDILKETLVLAKNVQRLEELNNLSDKYLASKLSFSTSNLINIRNNIEEALVLSKQINNKKGIGNAYYSSANLILRTEKKDKQQKALEAFRSALFYLKQSGEEKKVALCFKNMVNCLHHMGNIREAMLYNDSTKNAFSKLKDTVNFIYSYAYEGHCYFDIGNYEKAYKIGMDAWQLAQKTVDTLCRITTMVHLSNIFLGAGLPKTAIEYMHKILNLYAAKTKKTGELMPNSVIWARIIGGNAFLNLNKIDSAYNLVASVSDYNTDSDYHLLFGQVHAARKNYAGALAHYIKGYQIDDENGLVISTSRYANEQGRAYLALNNFSLAISSAKTALAIAEKIHALLEIKNALATLIDIYVARKDYKKVYHYEHRYKSINDSLMPEEYRQRLAVVKIQNELDNEKQQAELLSKENEIKNQQLSKAVLIKNVLITGIICLLLVAVFIIRNNGQKQKVNKLLKLQKEKVEATLMELRSTQSQLIQSEKMASLGELTAGIAHEIQNPLNFVNNFSEVNTELIDELEQEINKGNLEEVKLLAKDIKENEQKINHHGKRAGDIVKGMLQHSRSSIGVKEPTNINALADEYLRLAYHGLRAKDKSFNVELITDFDETIGNINIIPQDIGRVILNLITNAFYVVNEKAKAESRKQNAEEKSYEPTVSITTKHSPLPGRGTGGEVLISVKDNGNGIPQKILDKIFQPFFTTKPTGQGIGLGLSLSYDIVKAHGGEIKVETKEGEGAKFIIELPKTDI